MGEDSVSQGFAGTDIVAEEGATNAAGYVEEIDNDVEGEGLPERRGRSQDYGDPGRGVEREGVGAEVVYKPDG